MGGIGTVQSVTAEGSVSQNGGSAFITATCPAGMKPIGASYFVNAGSFYYAFRVVAFAPTSTGWTLGVVNTSLAAGPAPIGVTVNCATLP